MEGDAADGEEEEEDEGVDEVEESKREKGVEKRKRREETVRFDAYKTVTSYIRQSYVRQSR